MTSVRRVPEHQGTRDDDELSFHQARRTLARAEVIRLARESFLRFRYGDGFSHARALALQLCLAIVPLVIATVGLSTTLHADRAGRVLRETVFGLMPGGEDSPMRRALASDLDDQQGSDGAGVTALTLGLLVGMISLTVAMAQIERGANRIYGIRRDRPSIPKYGRAAVLSVLAGLPAMVGLLLLVAGPGAAAAIEDVYGPDSRTIGLLRWPVSVALSLAAITILMRHAPRRRNPPGRSWLVLGATVSLVLWILFTAALAAYLDLSEGFGAVYGQLTGIMALLIWSLLSSIAIFLGIAFAAQLEAERAGLPEAAEPDLELTLASPKSAVTNSHSNGTPRRESRG